MRTGGKITGSLIYDQILPLVDYCNDIKRKETYKSETQIFTYSDNFSPNNIRRLVISPDGALIYYHVKTPSNNLVKRASFNPQMVATIQYRDDYVPMINVLSADRICASIEEIIVIPTSNDGSCSLLDKELDFKSIIKSYKGQGSDIKTMIMNRYKRLYAFTIYNGGSLQRFLDELKTAGDSRFTLVSNLDFMNGSTIEYFHNNDWFKGYGSSANYYKLDESGSVLNSHFLEVRDTIEKKMRSNKVDKFKKERVGELADKYEQALKTYTQAVKCASRIRYIQINGTNALYEGDLYTVPVPLNLFEVDTPKSLYKEGTIKFTKSSGSDKDAYTQNIDKLQKASVSLYNDLFRLLINDLLNIANVMPITAKVMLKGFDRAIRVPSCCDVENAELKELIGYSFEGSRWASSLANICMLYTNFFASRHGEKSVTPMLTKEFWLDFMD